MGSSAEVERDSENNQTVNSDKSWWRDIIYGEYDLPDDPPHWWHNGIIHRDDDPPDHPPPWWSPNDAIYRDDDAVEHPLP